jgi:hypothetical protein
MDARKCRRGLFREENPVPPWEWRKVPPEKSCFSIDRFAMKLKKLKPIIFTTVSTRYENCSGVKEMEA